MIKSLKPMAAVLLAALWVAVLAACDPEPPPTPTAIAHRHPRACGYGHGDA